MTTDLKNTLAKKAGATGAVTTTEEKKPATMADFFEKRKHELAKALPSHVSIDRLLRIATSTIQRNPKLLAATQQSLLAGVVISSQLGLELNTPLGQAWLIPYDRSVNNGGKWEKVTEAQFQLGYQGVIDLAYRTGLYKTIYTEKVYEKDTFSYALGLNKDLIHVPSEEEDRGELKGVYAVYHLKNGGFDFKYWPTSKIMSHAKKYSKSWEDKQSNFKKGSAWADNFEGMAPVPVLKDLLKLAPKSIEFANQLSLDGSIKDEIKPDMSEARNIDDANYTQIDVSNVTGVSQHEDAVVTNTSNVTDESKVEQPVADPASVEEEVIPADKLVFMYLAELSRMTGETQDDLLDEFSKHKYGCIADLIGALGDKTKLTLAYLNDVLVPALKSKAADVAEQQQEA